MVTITQVNADTLIVDLGGGATIEVVKPAKVCPALDQGVDGYSYTYTGTDSQTRTSTAGSSSETQVVVPRFLVGDVVEIGPAPANLGVIAPTLASFRFQVVNSPAYWAKQSGGGG